VEAVGEGGQAVEVTSEPQADEAQGPDVLGGDAVALQLAGEIVETIRGLVGAEGLVGGVGHMKPPNYVNIMAAILCC